MARRGGRRTWAGPRHAGGMCRGKRRYRDHAEATRVLHRAATTQQTTEKPTRAYECPFCGGWHLSSKPALEDL